MLFRSGVGLIVFNDSGADWIVERNLRNFNSLQTKMAILKGDAASTTPVLFVDNQFCNFIDHLISLDVPIKEVFTPTVPWLSNDEISKIAENIGRNFLPISIYRLQTILKFIYPSATIVYKQMPTGVYGSFDFNEDILYISKDIEQDIYRTNFTIAHEIGHLVLHKQIVQKYYNSTTGSQIFGLADAVIAKLEIQANKFASSLLMPKQLFLYETARRITQLGIRFPLFKDNQKVNIQDCNSVCAYLQIGRASCRERVCQYV